MADNQEPTHEKSDGPFPFKVRGPRFIRSLGYYLALSNDSIPASALMASR